LARPDPRREAYRILRRVEEGGAYASALLERRPSDLADPRDAGLVTQIVLGVLRKRAILDHVIVAAASRPTGAIEAAVIAALRVGTYALLELDRVPDFAAVDTAVDLVKGAGHRKAAGFVNGVLRRIAREREVLLPATPVRGDVEALALHRSHPLWWAARAVARLGWEGADALMAANNEPAPTVLAPWPSEAATLADTLARDGVATEPCAYASGALRVTAGVPQRTAAFAEGRFWIQDEAGQLVLEMLGRRVGPWSVDTCAAPGGKSIGLAARTPAGGVVVAIDRHTHRLRRVIENAARMRTRAILVLAADMTRPAPLARTFDDVLVDAPCSGTGTLRRHPEIRWRLRPEDLPDLASRQGAILARAAALVRPGGRLVYAVCSLEPEEGDAVVASFLASHGDFERADPRGALVGSDLALRTSPADGLDGFFAVVLTRRRH
jgi:16S rRNA (cytosine967-C5)-methyltransferase